ncbi:hypothetical protein BJ912DRAFT_1058950 [Pholiota molesta]|nr:hypothetical protein BJ912DRAFT_1058950 [Pholiota molesta]
MLVISTATNSVPPTLKNASDRDAIDAIKQFLRMDDDPKWYSPKAFRSLDKYQVAEVIEKFESNSNSTAPTFQHSEPTMRSMLVPADTFDLFRVLFEAIRRLEETPPQSRTLVNNTVTPYYTLGWAVLPNEVMDNYDELKADTVSTFLTRLVDAYSDSFPELCWRITFRMIDAGDEYEILYITSNSSAALLKIAIEMQSMPLSSFFYQAAEVIQKFESNSDSTVPPFRHSEPTVSPSTHIQTLSSPFERPRTDSEIIDLTPTSPLREEYPFGRAEVLDASGFDYGSEDELELDELCEDLEQAAKDLEQAAQVLRQQITYRKQVWLKTAKERIGHSVSEFVKDIDNIERTGGKRITTWGEGKSKEEKRLSKLAMGYTFDV